MKIVKKKYIKIGAIILGSLLLFLIIVTLLISFLFRDQLIQIVKDQLNKQIDSKVTIAKIDFSLWKQFPNVSVQFDNVYAQSSNHYKSVNNINHEDTLLLADRIFFGFNLFKLIRSEYELKKVNIKDGYIKLKVDKNGNFNYNIVKPSEKKLSTEFNLELKDLVFTNTKFEYLNIPASLKILGIADKFRIIGNFKSNVFDLKIYTKMFINDLSVSNYNYILNKDIQIDLNLFVNNKKYEIRDAKFRVDKLDFISSGDFVLSEQNSINLHVIGKQLNFKQVISVLPEEIKKDFSTYAVDGKTQIDFSVEGPMGKSLYPTVKMNFAIDNGDIVHIKSGIELEKLYLNGSYLFKRENNSRMSFVKINKVSLHLGSGSISGNFSIENLYEPLVKINVLYKLNCNELKKFFNLDTVEVFSGSVDGNIFASGTIIRDSKFKISNIQNLVCNGQLHMKDVGIKVKQNDYFLERINGDVDINNDLNFKNISLFVHDNDFLINGSLLSWSNYLLNQKDAITLKADVTCKNLDLSKYFVKDDKKSSTEYSRELLFPDNLNLEVKLNINKFKLNRFNAKWASGYLSYKPKMFVLKSITFETMEGRVTGNGAIIQDINRNFIVKGQVDIARLDIRQMFYTFNNFSQNILRDSHLRGKVSGKVAVSSEWNNSLHFNKDKALVDADITIENGELLNFEPMMSLSKFIAVDELKNIKFSTLKNRIYIKERQIIIPQMDVYSSAFDISASGVHLFDNHYNYRLKVLLSDILWGKAKRAKHENEEFGTVEDDGLGKTCIPLSITGYNNDYKITYDSKKAFDVVKESFKNQKKEMKSVLNDEFGWFKNDTTFKKTKVEKKNPKFKVEWDDANDEKVNESKSTKDLDIKQKHKVEWSN